MEVETIIYNRTSTEEQNPENQLKDCEKFVDELNLNSYNLIEDKESAWKENDKRKGFKDLNKKIRSNKVKHLIVWDWDRIYRNRKKLKAFFEMCKVYNCKIHSVRQKFYEQLYSIPDPFNEIMQSMLLDLLGWLAQDESDKKSMRIKAAMRVKPDGVYSYKGNKWGRKELSTQAINKIIKYREEGKSMREITQLVTYSDSTNNTHHVSLGVVHKVLSGKHRKNQLKMSSSEVDK